MDHIHFCHRATCSLCEWASETVYTIEDLHYEAKAHEKSAEHQANAQREADEIANMIAGY